MCILFFEKVDVDRDGRIGHKDLELWLRTTNFVFLHGYKSALDTKVALGGFEKGGLSNMKVAADFTRSGALNHDGYVR